MSFEAKALNDTPGLSQAVWFNVSVSGAHCEPWQEPDSLLCSEWNDFLNLFRQHEYDTDFCAFAEFNDTID